MTLHQDNDLSYLTPVHDPALINKLSSEAMEESVPEGRVEAEQAKNLREQFIRPDDTSVELPAGLYNPITDEIIRDAEVRELTGVDEEILAKINDDGKMLLTMLDRGVVSVGGEKASASLLDELLIGDRDMLILAIRKATFGNDIELKATCPHCANEQEITISIDEDVPVRRHDGVEDRELRIETKQGVVELSLPTGNTQRKILAAGQKATVAELNTILLAACVRTLNGGPVLGPDAVRRFGIGDRAKLVDAIVKAAPGPRLEEVTRACAGCGKTMDLPLTLSDIFRP